jgi:type I restriction enzyme S subunit
MAGEAQTILLNELSVRITKGTTPTTLGRPFVEKGINFVKSEAISASGTIDPTTFAFIDEDTHAALSRSQLQEGDVLFSMAGVYLGKTAVVPESILPANTNQAVGIIRLDLTKADPRFIHYALSSPECRSWVHRSVAQSAQPNFNLRDIGNLPIPALPLVEQRAIAHILGTLDDKIELNRRMNETLEAMARALFKSWFVDFDPVRAKSEGRDPRLPQLLADLFPDSFEDSELGKIPKEWEVGCLGDFLGELVSGARPKGGAVEEGVPSVGAENVIGLGKYAFSKEKYVPREFFEELKRKGSAVRGGDVLLYKDGAQIGRKTYFDKGFPHCECAINEHVFILRAKRAQEQRFLFFWLDQDWMTQEIISLNSNSAQPGINQGGVRGLPLLVAPGPVVDAFNRISGDLTDRIFTNCIENQTLATVRDTLLPKLISGELHIERPRRFVGG